MFADIVTLYLSKIVVLLFVIEYLLGSLLTF